MSASTKRPRCRLCGATSDLFWCCDDASDATCLDLRACGQRVGAKRERAAERKRIVEGVEAVRETMRRDLVGACREGAQKALDEVLAVVRGRG